MLLEDFLADMGFCCMKLVAVKFYFYSLNISKNTSYNSTNAKPEKVIPYWLVMFVTELALVVDDCGLLVKP